MKKYCRKCKKETRHRKLDKSGFFSQCAIAFITKFSVDLREPDCECNNCGEKGDL